MSLQGIRCHKCGHEWMPRVESPLKCPSCGARLIAGNTAQQMMEAAFQNTVTALRNFLDSRQYAGKPAFFNAEADGEFIIKASLWLEMNAPSVRVLPDGQALIERYRKLAGKVNELILETAQVMSKAGK